MVLFSSQSKTQSFGTKRCFDIASTTGYIREKSYLAVVEEYNEESGMATLTQRNKMCLGDEIELLTPGEVGKPLSFTALFDEYHNPIEDTKHPYMKFYMKTSEKIREGDIIRAK